jgi:hypothetical protein
MKPNKPKKVEVEKEQAFYLVWSDRRGGYDTTPTLKHMEFEEAISEAKRLSAKHIGVKFYVVQAFRSVISEAKTTVTSL